MRKLSRVVLIGAAAAGMVALATPSGQHVAAPLERVIVQGPSVQAAAAAVTRAGGTVTHPLAVVDGVSALLPAGHALPGMVVTPDAPVSSDEADGSNASTVKSVYREEVRADALGSATGGPVAVAVIDTGISPVMGLADNLVKVPDPVKEGALADCANFTSETTCDDSYGHGTFLAGLIAGDEGMDPRARLVPIKIAGRSGSADVSQVLAGIQYAVSFAKDLNIKVINLSLGTNSNHDYRYDPLNRAVERAWQAGITVVVAASNRGPAAQTISKPGDDPLVLTVGAVDDRETPSRTDDTVPAFSGRGPVLEGPSGSIAKPDVVAPGVGLISYNVPGSHIDQTAGPSIYPVPGFRRGSGTSQATAVVSGAVALLLERTAFTPDQVKAALTRTAQPVTGEPAAVGRGLVNVAAATTANVSGATQVLATGGSFDNLDASRGQVLVTGVGCGVLGDYYRAFVDPKCDYVHGNDSANEQMFDAADYANGDWTGSSWYDDNQWTGSSWYGSSWYGSSWYGSSWYGYGGSKDSSEGSVTPLGTVLSGSSWYGVWQ
jgi:serine protease AprX